MKSAEYYLKSFSSTQIRKVELKLMKRSVKKLLKISSIPKKQSDQMHSLLAKFYVKQRSIFVIMELCNEDPTTHEILLNFIKTSIFEKLQDSDSFGLLTLRNGNQPFLALPLSQLGLNKKMKRKLIGELNFTSRSVDGKSRELQEALVTAFQESAKQIMNTVENGTKSYQGPIQWVLAIVGPQKQELREIHAYLDRNRDLRVNLLIIGVNITSPSLCQRYQGLCQRTEQGLFVNLNFEPDLSILFEDLNQTKDQKQGICVLNYAKALQEIEAAIQVYDASAPEPFISEHIDFN
ncbi:hypothetical protein FGO68_gene7214 [Halteria grandinella]|uniref:Uncharacterized protein n=1 Tax=Halteria grandinella TaxID=5974 RepID=A0A8J8P2D7_HALGN|nr:hypothetical protein FGO68_gene7214 [Halteria grandinella]